MQRGTVTQYLAAVIVAWVFIAGAYLIGTEQTAGATVTRSPDLARVVARQQRAIADLRMLVVRVCAVEQYEDLSARWEEDDGTRARCALFVSRIGK